MTTAETLTAAADRLEGLLGNPLARAPMHSPVGRALVALLRDRAGMSRGSAKRLGSDNPGGMFDYELALARAILGEVDQ